jgi:hypothetical protein
MRSFKWIKLLWVFLAVAISYPGPLAAAARKKAKPRGAPVAIWNLRALGLDKDQIKVVQKDLAQAFRRSKDWYLQSAKLTRSRLKKAGLDARSPMETVVPALGARYVLTGTMAGLGAQVSLDFKLLDGTSGAELRRAAIELPEFDQARAVALEELIVRLLSPEKWVGSLALEVSESGAQVFLDGEQVARSPLEGPLADLAPGKHILMIRKDGFGEFSKFIFVRFDQIVKLKVDLASATVVGLIYEEKKPEPKPKPKPEPAPALAQVAPPPAAEANWQQILGWTTLGVGAAAIISGGFLGWHADDLERQVENGRWVAGENGLTNEPELQALLDDGRQAGRRSKRMFIAGGSVAVIGGAFLIWGMLAGDSESDAVNESAVGPTGLVPALIPDGAGLVLSGRF